MITYINYEIKKIGHSAQLLASHPDVLGTHVKPFYVGGFSFIRSIYFSIKLTALGKSLNHVICMCMR